MLESRTNQTNKANSLLPVSSQQPAAYKFIWAVRDGESYNDFGQEESRDGDNTDVSLLSKMKER